MKKIAFYDTKPYDKIHFDRLNEQYGYEIIYFEGKLNARTAVLAHGMDAVVAFVNDNIDAAAVDALCRHGIGLLAMRSAGYNNVDIGAAKGRLKLVRVPDYSPYAIAEHTMALLLTLVRKIHKAYNRTREYNFLLNGLMGFDLHGKTIGVVGTGKIGRVFIDICKGFGMNVLAYDPYPSRDDVTYTDLETLCSRADIISLHCPLTKDTYHIINKENLALMKKGVYLINTSRGALIDSDALIDAIKQGIIGGAGLDVYEEESDFFYEDHSETIIQDDVLRLLVTMPNVLVTSHQAFLTNEALGQIAATTFENMDAYFNGKPLKNEIL
ncbi:MAG: 2-hydroxyacid dehydrogenase [Oscillospiraceae bacterium]|jgi:D-lactate dehydrogenase|nr:2-hydroxyacid dehydrogenase [Oscillospiraceae bacterium]